MSTPICKRKRWTDQQLALPESRPILVGENRTRPIRPILSANCVGQQKSADFSWQTTDFRQPISSADKIGGRKSADENRSSVLGFTFFVYEIMHWCEHILFF